MEFVEGEDLAQRLRQGAIHVDESIAIAKQIAEALEEAHERGIIHRDLKPGSISDRRFTTSPCPRGAGTRAVESFGCVTAELERMASWLKACGVDTVASAKPALGMEATGVYWIPVCAVLEDHGFEVILVDPRQVKNAKGRKTDVQDSAWIQKLHSFGLLSASFRPDRVMQPVRDYWRMRSHLVQDAARQIHLMQKNLEQMNVQLNKVLSDISGVSGMRILRAIVSGVRNPEELVTMYQSGRLFQ